MKVAKWHTKFDTDDDMKLQDSIREKYGYVHKRQYIFSRRLLEEMIKRKMTNKDLEKKTKLAKSTIWNYVNGKQIAGAKELKILSEKLMLPIDYLLGKSNSRTIKSVQLEDMIGLDYYAQGVLFGLKHNLVEVGDIDEKLPISDVHKNKLEIFSSFISNKANFEMILTHFESYVSIKQQLNNEIVSYKLEPKEKIEEKLKEDLDVLKIRIMKLLFDNLDNIANNL